MKNTFDTLTAGEVMRREVLTVRAGWPIDQLAQYFTDRDISGAPVVDDDGTIVGVVSITDLVRHATLHQRQPAGDTLHEIYRKGFVDRLDREDIESFHIDTDEDVLTREIMTPMVFQIDEKAPVSQVAALMLHGHIHRVFVTSRKRLVGIITTTDLMRLLAATSVVEMA